MIAFNTALDSGFLELSRSPIQIREFSLDDLSFWHELASDAVILRHLPALRHSDPNQLADYLFDHNSYTASQDGIRVGGLFLSFLPQSPSSVVVDMVVHPDLRSTSVATRMLRELVPLARSFGASSIRAILTPDNRSTLLAFERAGFNKVILLERNV